MTRADSILRRVVTIVVGSTLAAGGATVAAQMRPQFLGVTPMVLNSDALFDGRFLQEIRLSVNTADWLTLKERYLENTYYPADFRWRDQTVRNVGIRSRGTGSRSGTKPALKLDFGKYVSGQTFVGLKTIVLRNQTQDASNLNERLSTLMFRRLGLPASREAHTLLYVNNEYAGLYTVVEAVDKPFLKRVFGEDSGYLYDYDYPNGMAPYYFEYRGSDPSLYVPQPFKPDTHEDDPRPEFIEQWMWTTNETSPAVFQTAIADYIDVPNFILHAAIDNCIANNDGIAGDWGANNFYSYRSSTSTRFRILPWDMSESFKAGPAYDIFHNVFDVHWSRANRLLLRLLSEPIFKDQYLDDLTACGRSIGEPAAGATTGPGWLEREIDFEYAQIRDAALADPVKPYTNQQFQQAIADLRTFAKERPAFLSSSVRTTRLTSVPRRAR